MVLSFVNSTRIAALCGVLFVASLAVFIRTAFAQDITYQCNATGQQANDYPNNSSTCGRITSISCPWGAGTGGPGGTPICATCRTACDVDNSTVYRCGGGGSGVGCAPQTRRCNAGLTVWTCPCWGSGSLCPCLSLSSSCYSTSCEEGNAYQYGCTVWY